MMRRWVWILLAIVALLLRWPGLGKPLWEPEAITLVGARSAGLASLLMPTADLHRVAAWLVETGSLALVRLPYVLVGVGGVLLGWALGRVWRSWTLGFLLALALTFWPFKIYWDTIVRDYGPAMTFGLAAIVLWEWQRLRPGWGRFVAALAATALAALCFELALLWLAMPLCYVVWELYGAMRRRDRRAGLIAAGRAGAALAVLLLVLFVALGGGFWRGIAKVPQAGAQQADAAAPVVAPAKAEQARYEVKIQTARPGFGSFSGETAHMPGAGQALGFGLSNLGRALKPGAWSAAPLLALDRDLTGTSGSYIFNQLTLDPRGIFKPQRGGVLDSLLLALLLLGLAGLARRSLPLAVSLGFVALGTGALVFYNQHLRAPADRYYVLAALAGLIFVTYGVWVLLQGLVWILRRVAAPGTRRRLRAWMPRLAPGLSVALLAALVVGYSATARGLARHAPDDWFTFYNAMRSAFPQGAFFNGVRAQQLEVYQRLAAARGEAPPNRLRDATGFRLESDEQVFDYLNDMQGVAIFRPGYMTRQPYAPFRRFHELFAWKSWNQSGLIAEYAPLERKVFVTRGRLTLPLQERMQTDTPGLYQLELHHEVPGEYTLWITAEAPCQLIAARLDGAVIAFRKETSGEGRQVWSVRIQVDNNPMRRRQLQLHFNPPPSTGGNDGGARVEWRRTPPMWGPLAPGLEISPPELGRSGSDFVINTVLRVGEGMPLLTTCAALLVAQGEPKPLHRWSDIPIEAPRRALQAGDLLWSGPLVITQGQARSWIGKQLSVELIPISLNVPPSDPRLRAMGDGKLTQQEAAKLIKALPGRRVMNLRFAESGGQVEAHVSRAERP